MPLLDEDRLFPVDTHGKGLARELFRNLCDLPIISPHGHTDPGWFAKNAQFNNPAELFVTPDHYVFRMLYSQGVRLEDLGIRSGEHAENLSTPVPSGGPLRRITMSFVARHHGFDSTVHCKICSVLTRCSLPIRRMMSMTRSPTASRAPNFARACGEAKLAHPELKVEIIVTSAC